MQARRQPGSSFKPIIYATAIDQYSYTPATVIVDEPVVIEIEGTGEEWSPSNADGEFVGPISMRQALELSRNVCTIKILMDVSPGSVMALARRMGIKSKLEPNLSLALGTSELTLFELTSAYTVFPNRGLFVAPVLVKRIEDRYGNILEDNTKISRLNQALIPSPIPRSRSDPFTHKISSLIEGAREKIGEKECPSPDDPAPDWPTLKPGSKKSEASQPPKSKAPLPYPGTCPPAPPRLERPAMSPETAYIMTSLLQGVVTSGTGARLGKYLKRRDLCGKTGTTDNSQDAWFIGYNPNYTTGVWVGFDDNRPLGEKETGSMAALPIWGYFMKNLLEGVPEKRYPIPKKIVRRKMPTITHQKGVGVVSSTVIEPVYEPLSKKTLSLSPIDRPEAIAAMLQTPGGQNQIERGTPTNAAYVPGPQGGNRGLYRGAREAARPGLQGSPPQNGIKAWPNRPKSTQPMQPQPMYLNPVYRPPGVHRH